MSSRHLWLLNSHPCQMFQVRSWNFENPLNHSYNSSGLGHHVATQELLEEDEEPFEEAWCLKLQGKFRGRNLWSTSPFSSFDCGEPHLRKLINIQTQLGSWLIAFTASPRGVSDAHHWQQHLQDNDFRLLWESWAADLATLEHVTLFQCDSAGNAVEIIFLTFRSTLSFHLGTTRTGSGYKAGLLHLMAE